MINLKIILAKLQMLAFGADFCYYVTVRTDQKIQTTERVLLATQNPKNAKIRNNTKLA